MMIPRIVGTFMAAFMLLVFSVPAMAQAEEPATPVLPDPGITPDSFWYFLDVAADNMALALTFDTDARIQKEFEIAEERLAEVRAMALEAEFKAMAKAGNEHRKIMLKLKAEVKDVSDADPDGELEKELKFERKIKEHRDNVGEVEEELKVKIEVEGEITAEQQALIDSILASLDGYSGEVEIEIEIEKGKTKIRIEQETGRNGDEVEDELKYQLGITEEEGEDREDALEEMADVREELEELVAEAEEAEITLPEAVVAQINELLDQAQAAVDAGNYEEANDLADQADDLLDDLDVDVKTLIEGLEEEGEDREDALEEMADVREDLEELVAEAEEAEVTLPEAVVAQIYGLLDQAQAVVDAGNYEKANDLADQADDLLDDLEDDVENLIEESEEDEGDEDD